MSLSGVLRTGASDVVAGGIVGAGLDYMFSSLPIGDEPGSELRAGVGAVAQVLCNVVLWREYAASQYAQTLNPSPGNGFAQGGSVGFFMLAASMQPTMRTRLHQLRLNILNYLGAFSSGTNASNAPPVPSPGGPDNKTSTSQKTAVGGDRAQGAPLFF